ncbi:hypothetical protein [Pseudomonas oryzihabitans]|nr:hypothetical protein [Pseudomonas oryzihabitans]
MRRQAARLGQQSYWLNGSRDAFSTRRSRPLPRMLTRVKTEQGERW